MSKKVHVRFLLVRKMAVSSGVDVRVGMVGEKWIFRGVLLDKGVGVWYNGVRFWARSGMSSLAGVGCRKNGDKGWRSGMQ